MEMKITVKNRKETRDFTIGQGVKIKKDKSDATISDIMAGDHVVISYTGSADAPVITSINVHSQKAMKEKKSKTSVETK